jgi:hypothetical protein
VLSADPAHLASDTQAGIRLAEIDVSWASAEPTQGSFSASYLAGVESTVAEYHAAGWKVAISPGFQSPPGWVEALPDGQLIDQSGNPSGTPNYEFSLAVRSASLTYLSTLIAALGPEVNYYRDGLDESGEMSYPSTTSNQWWAFDAAAQGNDPSNAAYGTDPMGSWVPGTSTYHGQPVTTAEAQSFYNWYEGALESAEVAIAAAMRSDGFTGQIQLVMPGDGSGPMIVTTRIDADLAPGTYDSYFTMNTGTNWQAILSDPSMKAVGNTAVDVSSVGDGSGAPSDECSPNDVDVPLQQADPWVSGWSSTRWLTYLAKTNGYAVMGENPGNTGEADVPTIFGLVQSCGLVALQWAWDYQLYDGVHVSLAQYQAAIASSS